MRKPMFGEFRPGTTQTGLLSPKRLARVLKFWLYQVEVWYYQAVNNKGADQTADAQADLHLCCSHRAETGFLMTWLKSWKRQVNIPHSKIIYCLNNLTNDDNLFIIILSGCLHCIFLSVLAVAFLHCPTNILQHINPFIPSILFLVLVWFDFCFTALRHILGHFGRGQLT